MCLIMDKVIAIILLLYLSLVKLEAQINKNQDVPLQLNQASCPEDDKFEYDDFEKRSLLESLGILNIDCILEDPNLFNKILELTQSEFSDICDLGKSPTEIVNEITNKICILQGDKLELFELELKDKNGIIFHPSFNKIKYKRYKCLWNKLKSSGSSIYCNIIIPSDLDNTVQVRINVQEVPSSKTRGETTTNGLDLVDISLNHSQLNNDCDINIIKTIMHEFIHALIDKIEIQSFNENKNINDYLPNYTDYLSIPNYFRDHTYMAEKYMLKMIKGLKDIYGNKYTDEEYESIIWAGLEETRTYINLPQTKKDRILELQTIINSECEKSCY